MDRRIARVVFLLLLPLGGCKVLFPTDVDPCPLPPEQHPEAWKVTPMTDAAGNVIMYSYVCIAT